MEIFPRNKKEAPCPVYEVDLKKAWNTEGEAELFIEGIKALGIHKPALLYSGFDGDQIGDSSSSVDEDLEGGIFCCEERELAGVVRGQSALDFALNYRSPAIAIYDPAKMTKAPFESHGYIINDPSALLAYVKLRV